MNKDTSRLSPLAQQMAAGMSAFCDALESGEPIEKQFTVRSVSLNLVPRNYEAGEVKELRTRLKASQTVFANFLGVSPSAVRAWERNARAVPGCARRFMDEISERPELFHHRISEAMQEA